MLKSHTHVTKLRIEGHTDNVGKAKHNEKLSKARAEAVAKWLSEHEIEAQRLVTIGYGAKKPIKPNDSDANRAQNRRTEYYVEELDGKKVDGDGKSFEGEKKADADPKQDPKKVASTPASSKGKTQ
jgi:hypothetical protein